MNVRKALIIFMVITMIFAFAGIVFALQDPPGGNPDIGGKGSIIPNEYERVSGTVNLDGNGDDKEYIQGSNTYDGIALPTYGDAEAMSTHLQGTWNSPFTAGVDGYNYNNQQDYVANGDQVDVNGRLLYKSGPHGAYLTTTHRCRECHAVHRAAGQYKLLRADTRFEACDWCHGTGAGSGFNIQMDNDSGFTTEYNVGHTMGFGIASGKWRAPDDTYPAFAPNYYMGGLSCFDCHSPHANPVRLLGYNDAGEAVGVVEGGKTFGIANPGHAMLTVEDTTHLTDQPVYLSGSWLLIKNPDQELAAVPENNISFFNANTGAPEATSIAVGSEISDLIYARTEATGTAVASGALTQYSGSAEVTLPVNKLPIDWNNPIGSAGSPSEGNVNPGFDNAGATDVWCISEFCTDCHDGNAGQYTVAAPLFSEDRAMRETIPSTTTAGAEFGGSYDLAYGHDAQPRQDCERQLVFNPEDGNDFGPSCRNCHKGSTGCNTCHALNQAAWPTNDNVAGVNATGTTEYDVARTTTGEVNTIGSSANAFYKKSQAVTYTVADGSTSWRDSASVVDAGITNDCADDGFSWPHRTLGWKMLKDDLFGLDFIGPEGIDNAGQGGNSDGYAEYGESRSDGASAYPVHDLDSICLDCHNPTVWNATGTTDHVDNPADDANAVNDNMDDDLLLRGLP